MCFCVWYVCMLMIHAHAAHRGLKVTLDTLALHYRWLVLPYMGAVN